MVECAAAVHINFVVIPQMVNKVRNITSHRTLRTSVGATVWSKAAHRFMLYLAVVWEDLWATQGIVLTGKLKRFGYFLQCQTPDITELLSASRATIVYPSFACGTQSMSILALVDRRVHGVGADGALEQLVHAAPRRDDADRKSVV